MYSTAVRFGSQNDVRWRGSGPPSRCQAAAPGFRGSPDTVLAQIHCLRDEAGIGIIDFVFQGPSVPHGMLMWSLELFGTRVLPWLHEP